MPADLQKFIKMLKIWSDGPTSQFKYKYLAAMIARFEQEFEIEFKNLFTPSFLRKIITSRKVKINSFWSSSFWIVAPHTFHKQDTVVKDRRPKMVTFCWKLKSNISNKKFSYLNIVIEPHLLFLFDQTW